MTARQGLEARDVVLAEVAATYTPELQRALAVIEAAAAGHAPFSANDCRDRMVAASVPGPVRGLAFRTAVQQGLIRSAGYETSSDPGTHGKPIARYVSAKVPVPYRPTVPRGEVIGVPTRRDAEGRFSTTAEGRPDGISEGQTDLLAELGIDA